MQSKFEQLNEKIILTDLLARPAHGDTQGTNDTLLEFGAAPKRDLNERMGFGLLFHAEIRADAKRKDFIYSVGFQPDDSCCSPPCCIGAVRLPVHTYMVSEDSVHHDL